MFSLGRPLSLESDRDTGCTRPLPPSSLRISFGASLARPLQHKAQHAVLWPDTEKVVRYWCLLPLTVTPRKRTASLAEWLRRPPQERKIPGSNPACDGIFPRSSHTSDLKIGTPVATLPGAWRYFCQCWDWLARCQYTGTGCEMESLICSFYLSVAARKTV